VRLGPVSQLSERAAWAKFQPYLDRVNASVPPPPKSGMTLEAFVRGWRASVASNLEASTVRAAESHLRVHIVPALGTLGLREVNPKVIQAFVTSMAARGLARKTVENVLLTLSSLLRTARAWEYACGTFSLSDLTLPRDGVRKEQWSFTAHEAGRIIVAAKEPFSTLFAVVFMLGLRIGEGLALRQSDLDFERKIIRVRQSVDSATRKVKACKSKASSADLPMPPQLEVRLHRHLKSQHFTVNDADLLFANKLGRPYSANKRGSIICTRCLSHWAFREAGSTPVGTGQQALCWTPVQARQWCKSRCATRMHASRWESMATSWPTRNVVLWNHTRNVSRSTRRSSSIGAEFAYWSRVSRK